MKKWLALTLMLVAIIAPFGCKKAASEAPADYESTYEEPLAPADEGKMERSAAKSVEPSGGAQPVAQAMDGTTGTTITTSQLELPPIRMVIKTANISVRVKDVEATYTRAMQLAEEHNGYVLSGTISESEGARADITIKVDPKEFTDLITILEKLGEVEYKSISGQDVSEEYVDLKEQLRTELALKDRLLGYLDKAGNVQDMLYIEQELERVDGNVNRIKGRMQYLETMVAESTINLTIYSETPSKFVDWRRIGDGFVTAGQVLVYVFFGILQVLVVLIPLGIVVLLIVWLIIKMIRKRKEKKAQGQSK